MPELPEVETIVRAFRPLLEGRCIVRFTSRWAKQAFPSLAAVRCGIVGRRIERLYRRAKYIVAELSDGGQTSYMLIHLRMSGRFEWAAEYEREPAHVRTVFDLDDGNRLWFCDARKFGRIIYTTDLEAATSHLGVEPLERRFTSAALARVLADRKRQIKPLLLDQSLIVGVGNIYADEALFHARLHPMTRADRLAPEQIRTLRNAIRHVLRTGIRHNGTTIDWVYLGGDMQRRLKAYGRTGLPCPRCRTPIEKLRIAQRSAHFCPKCQSWNGKP